MKALLLNQLPTHQCVRYDSFPLWPVLMLYRRKGRLHRLYDSLGPLVPVLLLHLIKDHRLHQSMHRERRGWSTAGLSTEQGVGTQCLDGLIEGKRIYRHVMEKTLRFPFL